MRTRAFVLFSLALVVVMANDGCKRRRSRPVPGGASPVSTVSPPGYVRKAGVGWSIDVPATWTPPAQKGQAQWALSDPDVVDAFHANVNLVSEPYPGESLAYAQANLKSLRGLASVKLVGSKEDVVDADDTLTVEAQWTAVAPSTTPYKTLQVYLAYGGTGYAVTCSAAVSSFERYRPTCETILHSFSLTR
jgi:hypothetical protein